MDVSNTTARTTDYGINRITAIILGAVLVLVGLLGFVMTSPLLGLFEVDAVHNVIHLLTGAVLLAAAFLNDGLYARQTNITLGVVYLLVAIVGFVAEGALDNVYATNMADNWLHVLLGVALVGVGFADRGDVTRPSTGGAIR